MRTPAKDEAEARKRKEEVELCGKNRGPHDYIPMEWVITKDSKKLKILLCRVCFCHVHVDELRSKNPMVTY